MRPMRRDVPPDLAALDGHALLPRVLHDVETPDAATRLADVALPAPLVPVRETWRTTGPRWPLVRIEASDVLGAHDAPPDGGDADAAPAHDGGGEADGLVVRLPAGRMGDLVPAVRRVAARAPAAVLLDLTPLADTAPHGTEPWRPRRREELAELRAALGRPLWLDGIASPADAEVAAEAGLDAIVVRSDVGRHVAGPSAPEVLPEVLDAVAGMVGVWVGGPVRDGVDVFRYLALGAEAVLPDPGIDVRRLDAELRYAMRLTGCATLEDVGYEAVFAPLWDEGT